jgi:hypothetical protein
MVHRLKFRKTHISAYPGEALLVTNGANFGDGFSVSRDLCLGDEYELCDEILPLPMPLGPARQENAKPGDMVLDCDLTLMSANGQYVKAQVLATLDTQGCVKNTHLRTNRLLKPKTPYVLVDIQR